MNTTDLVRQTVRTWYNTEANRYEDARDGVGYRTDPMTEIQAERYRSHPGNYKRIADTSVVIPIVSDASWKERKRIVTLEVNANELKMLQRGRAPSEHDRGVRSLVQLVREQHDIEAVDVAPVKLPKLRAPKAVNVAGELATVYQVRLNSYTILATAPTLAQAKARAIELMDADQHLGRLSITAEVMRVDGDTRSDALARVERPVPAAGGKVTVEVTEHVISAKPEIVGFDITFDYHY